MEKIRVLFLILLYAFCINLVELCGPLDYDPTLLNTNYGKIQGACYQIPLDDPDKPNRTENVISWLSVPYAEPPVNELRFRKPVPVKSWDYVRDGTKQANACMQKLYPGSPAQTGISVVSEDCLYLNIFAPAKLFMKPKTFGSQNYLNILEDKILKPKLAPIMIFIHGGAFMVGSGIGNYPLVMAGLSDIIVITINYRLGPLGFMYLNGTNIAGNMGFLDQNMAFKWVYENAKNFGGDPNRITIWGQSAGSISVSFHLIYSPSWPYFRNAIMESGTILYSAMNLFTTQEASKRTSDVLASLGCGNDTSKPYSPSQVNECSLKLNALDIITASDNYTNQILNGNSLATELNPTFRLVLDGVVFKDTIQQSLDKRKLKKANILTGHCHDEAGFLVFLSGIFENSQDHKMNFTVYQNFIDQFYYYFPSYPNISTDAFRNLLINTYTNQSTIDYLTPLIQMMGEELFICPTIDLATIYSKYSDNKVFLYSYDYLSPGSPPEYGVTHGSELEMVFGDFLVPITNSSTSNQAPATFSEKQFSKQIMTYWTNFVKNDDPNIYDFNDLNKYTEWPQFKTNAISDKNLFGSLFFEKFSSFFNQYVQPLNTYMSFKINQTRPSNDFSFRKCSFWRNYNNFPKNL